MVGFGVESGELLWLAIGAAIVTLISLLLRDAPNRVFDWIGGRWESQSDWYAESIEYLGRITTVGTEIQAEGEINSEHLKRMSEISEDFVAHASSKPDGISEDIHSDVLSVAKYSTFIGQMLQELGTANSLSGVIESISEFRRRMRLKDISLDEIFEQIPEGDMEKMLPRIFESYVQSGLNMRQKLDLAENMMSALNIDLEQANNPADIADQLGSLNQSEIEEIPWDDVLEPLDDRRQMQFIEDLKFDIISVYLVEIPEELIDKINKST